MAATQQTSGRVAYSIPAVQNQSIEEIALVTPKATLAHDDAKTVLAALISTLRTKPATQIQTVETSLNLFTLALPGLRAQLGNARTVTIKAVSMSATEMRYWLDVETPPDGQPRPQEPSLIDQPDMAALAVTNTAAVYAAVASVLFAIGRQASESARTASLDKRPDALIRRFDIPEADQVLLPNRAVGPSRETLEMVYNSFANYTELRSIVISYFIGMKRSSSHYPLPTEVLMTNFHLMRGAGMTHVDAILRLAKMHPWTLKVAKLEPYWAKFVHELVKFNGVEEDVRPYHRLLVGQGDYLFISSEYRPLIAVAGDFIKDVEQTFSGYVYNAGTYTDLIAEVRSYAPHYTTTVGLANLSEMLGVPNVPLPKRPQVNSTPDSTVA